MKPWLVGVVAALLSTSAYAQSTTAPEIPFDSVPNFFKLPPDMHFGEASGVAVNSKGHVFVYSARRLEPRPGLRQHRLAAPGVRSRRQVPARDRQGPLRLVVRPHRAHRQGRQHLGHRQGLGHDRQVQPGRPRADGVRPQAGGLGRERPSARAPEAAAAGGQRPLPPADRRHLGHGTATSTSATATSTRASPSSSKDGDWVKSWGSSAKATASSTPCTRSPPTPRTTSTSATAATAASRCSIPTATSSTSSQIDIPPPADAQPAIGNMPNLNNYLTNGGTQTPGAPWAICITPPNASEQQVAFISDAFPGRVYKLSLDGKVLGMLGKTRQAAQAVRLDPRDRLPVRERNLRRRDPELARAEADPQSEPAARAALMGQRQRRLM